MEETICELHVRLVQSVDRNQAIRKFLFWLSVAAEKLMRERSCISVFLGQSEHLSVLSRMKL